MDTAGPTFDRIIAIVMTALGLIATLTLGASAEAYAEDSLPPLADRGAAG